jgi:hypothetical protein
VIHSNNSLLDQLPAELYFLLCYCIYCIRVGPRSPAVAKLKVIGVGSGGSERSPCCAYDNCDIVIEVMKAVAMSKDAIINASLEIVVLLGVTTLIFRF